MSDKLTVGDIYQIYTKYETIAGVKVKVVGTLAYSEISKVSYNASVLAVNERVISVKDENLESKIGSDTIYYLRAIEANADNTYAEYIVWDSIINFDKSKKLNKEYKYIMGITIKDSTNIPITQIITNIEKYITGIYGTNINFTINSASETENGEVVEEEDDLNEKLDKAISVIDSLNKLENKLIPASETIINSKIDEKLASISQELTTIKNDVSVIASNV